MIMHTVARVFANLDRAGVQTGFIKSLEDKRFQPRENELRLLSINLT